MTGDTIRRAKPEDLSEVYEIFYEAQVEGAVEIPPSGAIPAIFDHELETGELFVAEDNGQMVAFAAVLTRGAITLVAELVVRPNYRSKGYGGALLRHILPRPGQAYCSLFLNRSGAVSLAARAGMRPQWPCYVLSANAGQIGYLPGEDVTVVEGRQNDPAFVWWDAEVSRRHRGLDHAYWTRRTGAIPLWFRRHGRIAGYAYVQRRSEEWLAHPDALTIGPVGTRNEDDADACVCAAVRWAAQRGSPLRLLLPGPHPAFLSLIKAGLRITASHIFVASGPPAVVSHCYVPSGTALL